MDCIPAGMEAFVASNESQWAVIQRVIEQCDYYVLIIGGRYGSVTPEGISYTEKEFHLARKLGLPILAFVHNDPGSIAGKNLDLNGALREKLDTFRELVTGNYPVKFWSTAAELGGQVSRSLIREIRINNRPGWVRNTDSSLVELLEQLNALRIENQRLKESVPSLHIRELDGDLESGSDEYLLKGSRDEYNKKRGKLEHHRPWEAKASWDEIFADVGPAIINEASTSDIEGILSRFHGWADPEAGYEERANSKVHPETRNEVIIQLRALGLIEAGKRKRGVNDKTLIGG